MLRQEINLYSAFMRPKPAANYLTWNRFWYLQLIFVILLVVTYLYSTWNIHYLSSKNTLLEKKIAALQNEFMAQKKQFPAVFFSKDVTQSVEGLQRDLELQKNLLQSLVVPVPFSASLSAFSTLISPNTWLTEIRFTKGGNDITLKGKSNSGGSVQQFFSNLVNAKMFNGFMVNVDEINKPPQAEDEDLAFQISIEKKPS